jgi:hypothetical protein
MKLGAKGGASFAACFDPIRILSPLVTSSAMIQTARSLCYRLLALAACAAGAHAAQAQDLQDPRNKANQICATYGPGFVAGRAPGHCVKVQERLRVEPNARRAALDEAPPQFSSYQDAPMRDRLRLNGGFGAANAR